MDEIEWWEFDSTAEMADQVAGDIGFVIESAIEARGNARIAVPGGSTPQSIYAALLKKKELDWSKVTLLPTDDRLVRRDDALSNFGKIEALFGPRGANVISLIDESSLEDYRAAGRLADTRLGLLEWPLDLVWLGMGQDGHTASMLPGPDLDSAVAGPKGRRAVGVRPDPLPPEAPVDRVTLTAAAITSARSIMVVISGDDKKAILERAIEEGPLASQPIGRLVADTEVPIDIFWSAE